MRAGKFYESISALNKADITAATTKAAARVVSLAGQTSAKLAVAESLTGGAVSSAIVGVPGASAVFLGGVVAYSSDVKRDVLGVSEADLARTGPVAPAIAMQMAAGVCKVLGRSETNLLGVATTGVAGPGVDPQSGAEPGIFYLGLSYAESVRSFKFSVPGDRERVRGAAVLAAMELLEFALCELVE